MLQMVAASQTDRTSKGRLRGGTTQGRLRSAEQEKLQQLRKSKPDAYEAVLNGRNRLPGWLTAGRSQGSRH